MKKLVTLLTLGIITMSNLVSYANTKVISSGVTPVYKMEGMSPANADETIEADSDPDVKDVKTDNSESYAAEETKVEKVHEDNAKHSESKLGTSLGMFKLTAYCPCKKCNGTGYRGRISIHEILPVDKPVRKMISEERTSEEIKEYARQELGMLTLKESCMELIEQGLTTAEELVKVAYYD